MITVLCITFNVILVSGSSLSDKVHQTPADIYKKLGEDAKINCSHSIDTYNRILWYKQLNNKQLQFLGYMNVKYGNPEDGAGVKMEGDANKGQTSTLTINEVKANSSAVYFCAASSLQGGGNEAFFGGGTKLTVLDPDRTINPPKVTVLPPSPKECTIWKGDAEKTLLCVASGFYPDHVQVFWQVDGKNCTTGVATDNAALWDDDRNYTITSRLMVPATDWYNPEKTFTCFVSFFDGSTYENSKNSINGEKAKDVDLLRETFLSVSQSAKLSYTVFIIKSCIYGAFVVLLVWKLQGSAGKRNN